MQRKTEKVLLGEVKLLRSKRDGKVTVRINKQNQKALKELESSISSVKLDGTRKNIIKQESYIELEAQVSKEICLFNHKMERLRKNEIMNEDRGRVELIITRSKTDLEYEITLFHRWHKAPPLLRSL